MTARALRALPTILVICVADYVALASLEVETRWNRCAKSTHRESGWRRSFKMSTSVTVTEVSEGNIGLQTQDDKKAIKTWGFTDFDVSDEKKAKWIARSAHVNAMYMGLETCPSTGRLHFQGMITFKRTYRMTGLVKNVDGHVAWKAKKAVDAELYQMKESLIINVNNGKQGDRTDMKKVIQMVKDKKRPREMLEDADNQVAVFRNLRLIREWQYELSEPYYGPRNVYWIWGPGRTGKSKYAREAAGRGPHFLKVLAGTLQWIRGYKDQTHILLDEVNPETDWKKLLDITEPWNDTYVEDKGVCKAWMATDIWITSTMSPEVCFANKNNDVNDDIGQLMGRLTWSKHISELNKD